MASSADGSKLVALDYVGLIYTSTDSGVTWIPHDSARVWSSVATSADGSKLVAAVYGGQIYTSIDSGVSWTPRAVGGSISGLQFDALELQYVGGGLFAPLSFSSPLNSFVVQ